MVEGIGLGGSVGQNLVCAYRNRFDFLLFSGILSDKRVIEVGLGFQFRYPLVDCNHVGAENQGSCLEASHDAQPHDCLSAAAGHDYCAESGARTHISQDGIDCRFLIVTEFGLEREGNRV